MTEISVPNLVTISSEKFTKADEMKVNWLTEHDTNWRLYRNDYTEDDSGKASWQSRGYIPYLTDMVDREVGVILEAYLGTKRKLYEAASARRMLAAAMRELVMQELALNGFDEMLDHAVLEALLSGYVVIKHRWLQEQGRMQMQVIDPLDFYRVPDGMDGFVTIEAMIMEKGELERFKEYPGYSAEGINAAMSGMGADDSAQREDVERRKKDQEKISRNRYDALSNPVVLFEYWGRLYDEDGTRIGDAAKDEIFNWMVCNEQVVKPPERSYLWGNISPYSFGYIKRIQNDPYPPSIVHDHAVLQQSMTRCTNMVADKIYKHRSQFVAKRGHISNKEISMGISDARIIKDSLPGPPGLYVVTPTMTLEPEFQLLSYIERALHAMGMTETAMGQPTQRGAATLGEVEQRMASGMSFVGTIARRLERTLIRDVIRRTITYMLQFKLDATKGANPLYKENVEAFLGDDPGLAELQGDDNARKLLLEKDFAEVRVRGLSDQIGKQEKAAGLNYFLRMWTQVMQTAMQMAQAGDPEMQQKALAIIKMVNMEGLIYEAAEMTGFIPERVLSPEALQMVNIADAGKSEGIEEGGVPGEGPGMFGGLTPGMAGSLRQENQQAAMMAGTQRGQYD